MRLHNTYRGFLRNAARQFWNIIQPWHTANREAKLEERYHQCVEASASFEVGFVKAVALGLRAALEEARLACRAYWQTQKRTRPVWRIVNVELA